MKWLIDMTRVSDRHTTLHRPFLYNKGFNKKEQELTDKSHPSFTPVEQVREDSKIDMQFKATDVGRKAISEILKLVGKG